MNVIESIVHNCAIESIEALGSIYFCFLRGHSLVSLGETKQYGVQVTVCSYCRESWQRQGRALDTAAIYSNINDPNIQVSSEIAVTDSRLYSQ